MHSIFPWTLSKITNLNGDILFFFKIIPTEPKNTMLPFLYMFNASSGSAVNAALISRRARPDTSSGSVVNAALISRRARPELVEGYLRALFVLYMKHLIALLFPNHPS